MAIAKLPAGMTGDAQANFGYFGLLQNVNNYAEATTAVTTAGTSTTLTAAQVVAGMTILNAGASGGFTINLPATSAIIAALGNTIPLDGTYSEPIHILNNSVGQTGTITAGDSSTTLTGTMTCATATTRKLLLNVTSSTTITIQNCGSWGL